MSKFMKVVSVFIAFVLFGFISVAQNDVSKSLIWKTKYDGSITTHMETSFSSDSKYYAYGSNSGSVFIRDVATSEIYITYQEQDKQILCVAFQPKGSLIASADKKGSLVIYDYVLKTKKFKIEAHDGPINSIAFSPDGDKLITGSNDNVVKVWNVATGSLVYEIKNIKGNVCYVKVTSDSKKLIVTTKAMSNGVTIYDFNSGSEIIKVPAELVETADLSSDGKYLVASVIKKKFEVWNLNS